MKKLTLLLILFLPFLNSIYSQSFFNVKINAFRFNDDNSKAKVGFGIGHQTYLCNKEFVKIIMSESLDFKRTNFIYFNGGLAGGSSTKGIINFVNAQVDFRTRVGKTIFGEAGFYGSYSLLKKITNGQVNVSRNCSLAPSGVNCTPQTYSEITTQNKDFNPFDYGLIVGIGYPFKDFTVVLDGQLGLYKIVNLRDYQFKSRQINVSITFPLRKLKF